MTKKKKVFAIVCLRLIGGLAQCAGGDRVNTNGDMADTIAKTSSATNSTAVRTDSRNDVEMKGFLLKWTNYIKGYQRRWFVLSGGVLSYYRLATGFFFSFPCCKYDFEIPNGRPSFNIIYLNLIHQIHQIHQINIERQSVTHKKILRKKGGEKKNVNDIVVHVCLYGHIGIKATCECVN